MASQPHIVLFPYLALGHILPMLDLSKVLSRRGLKVTIITTLSNSPFINSIISKKSPEIQLREIPFPSVDSLPEGCENTSQLPSMDLLPTFMAATKNLQQPFEQVLKEMTEAHQDPPIAVISDSFLGWTISSCRAYNIPAMVCNGTGSVYMAVRKSLFLHQTQKHVKSYTEALDVPKVPLKFPLTIADLPSSLREMNLEDPSSRLFLAADIQDLASWGVIINSFVELEPDYVASLESFYNNGAKAWCVGPLLLYDEIEGVEDEEPKKSEMEAMEWLKEREKEKSVIYVSFGSQNDLSKEQLDEVALGLEMSGHEFMWVIRSRDWNPPNGVEERVNGKGLIVREWIEQRRVLAHSAVGGFLSHCGWNSVMESLSRGVPILAWPLASDQNLNAKFLVEELKVGERVPNRGVTGEEMLVGREMICRGVKDLMGGEKGRKARERAEELGKMARRAVQQGGSSYNNLTKLIEQLSRR